MRALGWWLMLVGSLRLASVWFGFFDIWALRLAVFSKSPMTEVHGRTFGVWTLLTCTLCFLCAFNLDNKQLYLATFLSFIYALGHFLTEYLIYQTMAIANLTTVSIFAGTSIIWMLLQWNAHQPQQAQYKSCFIILTSLGYYRKFSRTGLRLNGFCLPSDGKSQVFGKCK